MSSGCFQNSCNETQDSPFDHTKYTVGFPMSRDMKTKNKQYKQSNAFRMICIPIVDFLCIFDCVQSKKTTGLVMFQNSTRRQLNVYREQHQTEVLTSSEVMALGYRIGPSWTSVIPAPKLNSLLEPLLIHGLLDLLSLRGNKRVFEFSFNLLTVYPALFPTNYVEL